MRARHLIALAALAFGIALTISRLGLVMHEVVGHGAAAEAMGSDVSAWGLYAFGGGWIRYEHPGPLTGASPWVITLGGIGVELVLAVVCGLLARRARPGGALAFGLASAAWSFAIHAGWYLSAGAFHGFGDGAKLHAALGDARVPFAIAVGLAAVAAAVIGGRATGARLRGWAPSSRPLRFVAAALALALAGHAALTVIELRVRPDPTYAAVMETATDRAAAREVAIRIAAAQRAGRPLDESQIRRERRAARRRHAQLPFGPGLLAALGLAAAVGIATSKPRPDAAPAPSRAVAFALACAAGSVALVVVLDALAP